MSVDSDSLTRDEMSSLQEKYEKVKKLLDEESKRDPPTDPYRSKYIARGILSEMKSILSNKLDTITVEFSEAKIKVISMLGVVLLQLGLTSYETEEISTAEEQLSKCVKLLTPYARHPFCIITLMNSLNQLGIIWSERDDPGVSRIHLEKCEKLYKDFSESLRQEWHPPISVSELFDANIPENAEEQLEKIHTLTLYYLAQVYGTLGKQLRSAIYCHNTLKRQLESKNYDSIDWALNAATLSQFFATHNGFQEARHHLSAASAILDQLGEKMRDNPEGTEEERDARRETFRHRSADVARCWAKYDLNLLAMSQARLMCLAASTDGDCVSPDIMETEGIALRALAEENELNPDVLENLEFSSLELDAYESRVSCKPVNVFDEAREIFLDAKKWLAQAQEYYTMDHHASDAVEIVQDISRLYQNLAFFEDNEQRQSRMHKRRVDLLEGVLVQINPQYYLPVCRQLWFELAEIYSEMLEIKKQKLRVSNEPTAHNLSKINTLAQNGITHLNSFINSMHEKRSKSLPEELSEEVARPVLLAFFYLGKLYRELVTPDKVAQATNLQASIDSYKFVVSYCDKYEEVKKVMGAELGISREMLELLPIRLRRLQVQAMQ